MPVTAGQTDKKPMLIPVRMACIDPDGVALPLNEQGDTEFIVELDSDSKTFVFTLPRKPVPSLFRNFSAPVRVQYDYTNDQLAHLLDCDTDAYSRWNAGQELQTRIANGLIEYSVAGASSAELSARVRTDVALLVPIFAHLIEHSLTIADDYEALSMTSRLLTLPSRSWLDGKQDTIHVHDIDRVVRCIHSFLATELADAWQELYNRYHIDQAYKPDFSQASMRQLKNVALSFLVQIPNRGEEIAWQQLCHADNMTDSKSALSLLVNAEPSIYGKQALERLYSQWSHEPLVVTQWFELQAGVMSEDTLAVVQSLWEHPAFDIENPNKVRSVLGVFAHRSYTGFHRLDGAGYAWFTGKLLEIDQFNSQVAARLATPLSRWQRYQDCYALAMKRQLEVLEQNDISRDLREVVEKSLCTASATDG